MDAPPLPCFCDGWSGWTFDGQGRANVDARAPNPLLLHCSARSCWRALARHQILVVAALLEIVGGALIAVGPFTRIAAFICSGEIAAAYFMFHAPQSFWPAVNQGDAAILFGFVFLTLAFAGAGARSVDAYLPASRQSLARA